MCNARLRRVRRVRQAEVDKPRSALAASGLRSALWAARCRVSRFGTAGETSTEVGEAPGESVNPRPDSAHPLHRDPHPHPWRAARRSDVRVLYAHGESELSESDEFRSGKPTPGFEPGTLHYEYIFWDEVGPIARQVRARKSSKSVDRVPPVCRAWTPFLKLTYAFCTGAPPKMSRCSTRRTVVADAMEDRRLDEPLLRGLSPQLDRRSLLTRWVGPVHQTGSLASSPSGTANSAAPRTRAGSRSSPGGSNPDLLVFKSGQGL